MEITKEQIENLKAAKQKYLDKSFDDGKDFSQEYSFYLAIRDKLDGMNALDLDIYLNELNIFTGNIVIDYLNDYIHESRSRYELANANLFIKTIKPTDLCEYYNDDYEYGLQISQNAGGKELLEWLDDYLPFAIAIAKA